MASGSSLCAATPPVPPSPSSTSRDQPRASSSKRGGTHGLTARRTSSLILRRSPGTSPPASPHPRKPWLTDHGVLAPAFSWRDHFVRFPPPRSSACRRRRSRLTPPHPRSSIRLTVRRRPFHSSRPLSWSGSLRRVFEIHLLHRPRCRGGRRLIAPFTDPLVVRRIHGHHELPSEPPPVAPARQPPQLALRAVIGTLTRSGRGELREAGLRGREGGRPRAGHSTHGGELKGGSRARFEVLWGS